MIYPAHFEPAEEGGYVVTFSGLPGATQGDTLEEAERAAVDCLVTVLASYAKRSMDFPAAAAPKPGECLVFVPSLDQAKLALIRRMAELKVSNVELAKRLGCSEGAVRRLVNLNHESKLSKIEAALAGLGKRLSVHVDELSH